MITLQLIRGHRLKLFAKRLNLHKEFIDRIDIYGMSYVKSVTPIEANYARLVVLVKVLDSNMPLPVTFLVHSYLLPALMETFQLEEEEYFENHE